MKEVALACIERGKEIHVREGEDSAITFWYKDSASEHNL
jgi:hypothetical protein